MLKKYEISGTEEDLCVTDRLDREILMVISFEESKAVYLLKTDLTTQGRGEINKLLRFHNSRPTVKAICTEKDLMDLEDILSAVDVSPKKIATYIRRCDYQYKFSDHTLKYFEVEKIRVMIVDDSKTIRSLLEKIFQSDSVFEVVASLEDPTLVMKEIQRLKPDVMTLDIHMPKMTGVELLRKFMPRFPVPTVMISSVGIEEGRDVITALELGAVDYIQKPSFEELSLVAPILIEKIKIAAQVDVSFKITNKKTSNRPKINLEQVDLDKRKLILIGSSTGGTEAIRKIFRMMPKKFPPVLITQHIPKLFSLAFAESLAREFGIEVFEAKDGQEVLPNQILIAPGGLQMELVAPNRSKSLSVRVFDGPLVNRHKPSVDVLFESAATILGKHAIGVILTGMGGDGAKGLKRMRDKGAATIAQDQATSVVYGMPKVANEMGAVEKILPLEQIAEAMIEACRIKVAS